MRSIRIYQSTELHEGLVVQLDQSATRHIIQVLRLSIGTPLIVFNGKGGEFTASIVELDKRQVKIKIAKFIAIERESTLNLHLAQGIARNEKMDLIIQKAVELGVSRITPLITQHSIIKLSSERWEKRWQHWQNIIISACEQCGRNQVPKLDHPILFNEFISTTNEINKFILHPEKISDEHKLPAKINAAVLLIGPEGGFSDEEITLAQQRQYISIQLGTRILRTETAGLAGIVALQVKYGDLVMING